MEGLLGFSFGDLRGMKGMARCGVVHYVEVTTEVILVPLECQVGLYR